MSVSRKVESQPVQIFNRDPSVPVSSPGPGENAPPDQDLTAGVQKVQALLNAGKNREALQATVGRASAGVDYQNARAVCLMRLDRADEAVSVLRGITLGRESAWFRDNVPEVYKLNLATALALTGNSQGAVRILAELTESKRPRVAELNEALARWTKGLSWWQRIQWKGGVAIDSPVKLDFLPGELV